MNVYRLLVRKKVVVGGCTDLVLVAFLCCFFDPYLCPGGDNDEDGDGNSETNDNDRGNLPTTARKKGKV